MKRNEGGKVLEIHIVIKDVWRKGGEFIGIEICEGGTNE